LFPPKPLLNGNNFLNGRLYLIVESTFMPKNIFRTSVLLLLITLCGAGSLVPGAAQAPSKARRWRVMVIVPEQHLARPRIPDPAVETMICEQLINAGYKVIDQDRIADLRYSAVIDRIQAGGPGTAKELAQLRRKFGADILITGEAFTQEVQRQTVETDAGPLLNIRCRARVELKGIRMDTGEKIYADSIQKTGAPEPTVELSSKACLEMAAEEMAPEMLQKLDKLAFGTTQQIELEVRNVGSLARANQIEGLLRRVPGVQDVIPGDYDANTYSTEISISKMAVRSFATRLEIAPALKKFNMKVQSANGSKIIVNCK
jgi:hypothetical protein